MGSMCGREDAEEHFQPQEVSLRNAPPPPPDEPSPYHDHHRHGRGMPPYPSEYRDIGRTSGVPVKYYSYRAPGGALTSPREISGLEVREIGGEVRRTYSLAPPEASCSARCGSCCEPNHSVAFPSTEGDRRARR